MVVAFALARAKEHIIEACRAYSKIVEEAIANSVHINKKAKWALDLKNNQ